MLRAALLPIIAAGLALLAGPAAAQAPTLRVSAIPDENPTELLRKFKPLGAHLEKETGMKVAWTPVNDYAAVVEGGLLPVWGTLVDLGCGRASTSIFLRSEFDVQVWATDLWTNASENLQRIRDLGLLLMKREFTVG